MNFFQNMLFIVSVFTASLKYNVGREIPDGRNMIFKYNGKHPSETSGEIWPFKVNTTLRDTVDSLKLRVMKAVNHLTNSFPDYIPSILWRRNIEGFARTHKTTKTRRGLEDKKTYSSGPSQIHINLSPYKISVLDSNGNDYFDWDKNLTDYPTYDTNGSFNDADTDGTFNDTDINGTFNDTDINGTFNDTDTNKTETPIIELTSIAAILPVCAVGDDNCTKCQDISPFCHYMYSESRCVYYNYIHASKFYECGERWFPVDKNEALFATALVTIAVSSSLLGYLIYLRYTVGYEGEVALVATDEYADMRRVMQQMHEKYPRVAKNMESSSDQFNLVTS